MFVYLVLNGSWTTLQAATTEVYQVSFLHDESSAGVAKNITNMTYCRNPGLYKCYWEHHPVDADGCIPVAYPMHTMVATTQGYGPFIPTLLDRIQRFDCNAEAYCRTVRTQKFVPGAGLKGRIFFKVRPHVPGIVWETTNAPVCIFDSHGEEKLQEAWETDKQSMHLGTMDCSATFIYGQNTRRIGSSNFTVSKYGDMTIRPTDLLQMSESLDKHSLDATTRTSWGPKNPYECAPRSRGGSFQLVVSTEQAFTPWLGLQVPKNFWCWFGSPTLEKFMNYDVWNLMSTPQSGYRWKCFELKINIAYDPLFSYESTSIRQNDATSSIIIDESNDVGFAFLFRSETGMVPRFSLSVFLVALMTLGWVLSLPSLACSLVATNCSKLYKVYQAALTRPFHPAKERLYCSPGPTRESLVPPKIWKASPRDVSMSQNGCSLWNHVF